VGRLVRRPRGPPHETLKEGSGTEEGVQMPLAKEGGLYLNKLFAGTTKFLVTPLTGLPN